MGKINKREYEGVLKSKNANRFKYTVVRICESRNVYYSDCPQEILKVNDADPEKESIVLWGGEFFGKEFFKAQDLDDKNLKRVGIHEFYRETLPALIKRQGNVLVFPNLKGEGKIVTAKQFRIALFLKLWEGEQEEWMFN